MSEPSRYPGDAQYRAWLEHRAGVDEFDEYDPEMPLREEQDPTERELEP